MYLFIGNMQVPDNINSDSTVQVCKLLDEETGTCYYIQSDLLKEHLKSGAEIHNLHLDKYSYLRADDIVETAGAIERFEPINNTIKFDTHDMYAACKHILEFVTTEQFDTKLHVDSDYQIDTSGVDTQSYRVRVSLHYKKNYIGSLVALVTYGARLSEFSSCKYGISWYFDLNKRSSYYKQFKYLDFMQAGRYSKPRDDFSSKDTLCIPLQLSDCTSLADFVAKNLSASWITGLSNIARAHSHALNSELTYIMNNLFFEPAGIPNNERSWYVENSATGLFRFAYIESNSTAERMKAEQDAELDIVYVRYADMSLAFIKPLFLVDGIRFDITKSDLDSIFYNAKMQTFVKALQHACSRKNSFPTIADYALLRANIIKHHWYSTD